MIYELRIYEAAPGKLGALHRRFRDHTLRIFANHGLDVVGFWTYAHGGWSDQLVYLMKLARSRTTRWPTRWTWLRPRRLERPARLPHEVRGHGRPRPQVAFRDDEEWRQVRADSERDGAIVTRIRSDILAPTDYSPLP